MSEERPNGQYTQLDLIRLEEKAFAKFAALRLADDDKVSIPKIYYDIAGDHAAAAVLDEILFWTLPNKKTGKTALRVRKEGVLWLAVSRSDWWERKRLTERQADRGIDTLIELGLVEKSIHRFNGHAQMHLRVIAKEFFVRYGAALQKLYLDGIEEDDGARELADLYEMMGIKSAPGIPELDESDSRNGDSRNRELRNGDSDSRNGDSDSRKRETINILHTYPPTNPPDSAPSLPAGSGIDWMIAGNVPDEEIQTHIERERAEKERAALYEQAMGYNPLPWWSNRDLLALLKFLLTKSPEEVKTFAAWSRRQYSTFDPAKARQYPRRVIEFWPQAFPQTAPAEQKEGPVYA